MESKLMEYTYKGIKDKWDIVKNHQEKTKKGHTCRWSSKSERERV